MSTVESTERVDDVFQSEQVETKLVRVQLSSIVADYEGFAFRDASELTEDGLKPLREDIAVNGVTTPVLLAELPDGKYLLLNGHRRYTAIRQNVKQGVQGFTEDMLLPAYIIVLPCSELGQVSRAIAANIQQRTISAEGRQKAVLRLKKLGMPLKEIARLVGYSSSTVERDLALASSECMLAHVNEGNITGTAAATLVKAAADANKTDELCEAFAHWVDDTQQMIEAEGRRRQQADEEPQSKADKLPRSYLTIEQVRVWKEALKKGLPLGAPEFRFRAQITQKKGDRRIVVDRLAKSLNELSAKDTAKLVVRFADLVEALTPVVQEKAEAEKQRSRPENGSDKTHAGRKLLKTLGVEHLLEGEFDDEESTASEDDQEAVIESEDLESSELDAEDPEEEAEDQYEEEEDEEA